MFGNYKFYKFIEKDKCCITYIRENIDVIIYNKLRQLNFLILFNKNF